MIAGIDIGTSYSSICVLDGSGKIQPVDIATGTSMFGSKYSLPSAVFVEDQGNVLVGQAAMNSRKRRPQNFRMEFKRDLGQDIPIVLGNSSFLPEDFYTELFRHMKNCVARISDEPMEKVCITCPAAFGKKKREKVLKAAKAAGFFDVRLLSEPVAAAMSFKEDGILSGSKKLLIYDFGGGTFDVSLLSYENGRFSLMTEPSGLERCGGIDIDRMIFKDMQKCIDPEILGSISKDPKKAMRLNVQLSELAVKAKHHLSTASVYEEYIEVGMDDFEYTLTADRLNTMIAGMIGQTIDVCRRLVEDAGIKAKDLSAILMVGGTSRVPLVQTMVKQMAASVPVYCSRDVDLAVAKGALAFVKDGALLEEKSGAGEKSSGAETDVSQAEQVKKWYDAGVEYMLCQDMENAFKMFIKAAQKGHVWAQTYAGDCYLWGEGTSQNYERAYYWHKLSAEQGNTTAQTQMGYLMEKGLGVPKNEKEAVKWYKKAAAQGDTMAQDNLGVMYIQGRGVEENPKEAVKWFTLAAQKGDREAQYMLGLCYYEGSGAAMDYGSAFMWTQKAAQQGHVNAQYNLAYFYEQAIGTGKNQGEAFSWYLKAARQGHAEAQFQTGICYLQGAGTEKDDKEAVFWLDEAAKQGDADAQYCLGNLYYEGSGGLIMNDTAAFRMYEMAASQGHPGAQYCLGYCYQHGKGRPKDHVKAVQWYQKAAQQGDTDAQTKLGTCFAKGIGVKKDVIKAAQWYQKAADQGNPDAQMRLGKCYETGQGVPKNPEMAKYWYSQAQAPELVVE